jgi:hypothetical protein
LQYAPIVISVLALVVSGATLWLSHLRKGKLKMTKPTVIFFGPDGGERGTSKLYLRTLLYSTAKRGVVLEHLYVRLRRGETQQNFNIWVYGDKDLARGSGLFIGQEGVATNHHFLLPTDIGNFEFVAGDYRLEVFGKTVEQDRVHLLSAIDLVISPAEAADLKKPDHGINFDWGPDANRYQTKIEGKPSRSVDTLKLLEVLQKGTAIEEAK